MADQEPQAEAEPSAPEETPTEVSSKDVEVFFDSDGETKPEETQSEEPAEDKEEPQQPKTVPHGAFHQEREQRKQAQAEAQELRDKVSNMEGRFSEVIDRLTPQEPLPDFDEDPAGALQHQQAQTTEQLDQITKTMADQQQQALHNSNEAAFVNRYRSEAQAFASQNADFNDAYQHLMSSREKELQTIGYNDPAQRQQILLAEEMGIVDQSFKNGANPGETIYNLAKSRGFSASAVGTPASDQKIESQQKGQEAAKSLTGGGGDTSAPLTLEALAEMDGTEFDEAWDKQFGTDDQGIYG